MCACANTTQRKAGCSSWGLGALPIGICFPYPQGIILLSPTMVICLPVILLIPFNAYWYGERANELALGGRWLLFDIAKVFKWNKGNDSPRPELYFQCCYTFHFCLENVSLRGKRLRYENVNKTEISSLRSQPQRCVGGDVWPCAHGWQIPFKRRVHRNKDFNLPESSGTAENVSLLSSCRRSPFAFCLSNRSGWRLLNCLVSWTLNIFQIHSGKTTCAFFLYFLPSNVVL